MQKSDINRKKKKKKKKTTKTKKKKKKKKKKKNNNNNNNNNVRRRRSKRRRRRRRGKRKIRTEPLIHMQKQRIQYHSVCIIQPASLFKKISINTACITKFKQLH
jgi:hypothetical protein